MIPELKFDAEGKASVWMKKGEYIANMGYGIAKEVGYIDTDNNIAYMDDEVLIMNEKKWKATDILSGCLIVNGRFFEDCYKNVEAIKDKILDRRQTEVYKQHYRNLQLLIKND